ncbi:MAG: hypothetical protein P8171_19950 [Candidatus Thiodiazotropha sp.]
MNKKIILIISLVLLTACNSNDHNDQNAQEDILSVTFTLNSLPDELDYNKSDTLDGHIEYQWGVTFDISGDGAIDAGDVVLQILHFKYPDMEPQTGPITDLPADLWVYTSNTEISSEAEASMQVSGNTITISIDKSAYPALKQITGDTLVYFETFAHDPTDGSSQYDYYPSYATFMSMPADKHFTDAENDASPSYIDLLSMSISL